MCGRPPREGKGRVRLVQANNFKYGLCTGARCAQLRWVGPEKPAHFDVLLGPFHADLSGPCAAPAPAPRRDGFSSVLRGARLRGLRGLRGTSDNQIRRAPGLRVRVRHVRHNLIYGWGGMAWGREAPVGRAERARLKESEFQKKNRFFLIVHWAVFSTKKGQV